MRRNIMIVTVLAVLALFFISCSNKSKAVAPSKTVSKKTLTVDTASWFVFSQRTNTELRLVPLDNLNEKKTKLPTKKWLPWTEALRVSGIGLMYNDARVLINQVGVFSISQLQNKTRLKESFKANLEFKGRSASGLYQSNAGTIVKLNVNVILSESANKNTIEKKATEKKEKVFPFLYRYNPISEKCEALLSTHDISVSPKAECTALEKKGEYWYASFKEKNGENVSFEYLRFASIKDLIEKKYQRIGRSEFQRALNPKSVAQKSFFSMTFKQSFPIYAEVFHKNKAFRFQYKINGEDGREQHCYGFSKENKSGAIEAAVVFPDGTLYIQQKGTTKTISLPKLPEGFVYTYCVPYKNSFAVAWEEQSFFYVRNAGLYIPQQKTLKKID